MIYVVNFIHEGTKNLKVDHVAHENHPDKPIVSGNPRPISIAKSKGVIVISQNRK